MAIAKIKALIRRLVIGHDINTYYFSQSGEDAILKGFFYEKLKLRNPGFFVDIGAFHPTHGNNTYFFYINGWRGINVDASPGSIKAFNASRTRDINVETGIALTEETRSFYYMGADSMNSFSQDFIEKDRNIKDRVQQEMQIKTIRLETLLDKYLPPNQPIDIMSVDVEGMDLEVLQSNNWEKYTPKVIVVEMQAKKLSDVFANEINTFLTEKGYEPYAKTLLASNLASVVYAHKTHRF
jgi:FkbM family methyltransferase